MEFCTDIHIGSAQYILVLIRWCTRQFCMFVTNNLWDGAQYNVVSLSVCLSVCLSVTWPKLRLDIKDTSYVWGRKQQNLQLLDILACNSAKWWSGMVSLQARIIPDGLLTELRARMSRSCRFCCFLPHTKLVSSIHISESIVASNLKLDHN